MPIIAKDESKVYHLAPAGMVQAVCFDVWDLGLQETKVRINGQEKTKIQHKIKIGWELAETIQSQDEQNGKPHKIYKNYTLSLHEKAALCKDLTSWRGQAFTKEEKKSFDVEKLVGVNCFLNMIHVPVGDKTYANISAINPLPKSMPTMLPQSGRELPEWIKKIQDKAVSAEPEHVVETEENDIPF